jgi:hypothetical protein
MRQQPESGDPPQRDAAPEEANDEPSSLWSWFAIGVLLFCWIAEASMCAERGF